mmetsp:Transcript_19341/g.53157  ORF Transcript_19341/g.53157 Transcript_19341/m.53157 type:complete len:988 (-) Transcript_19341:55-3018(-)
MALYDPFACEEGFRREMEPLPTALKARRVFVAGVLATLGTVGFAMAYFSKGVAAKTAARFQNEITQLEFDEDTVCDEYPYLKLEKGAVLYSNLGNQGPDSGQGEGMVLLAKEIGGEGSEYGHEIKIVMNATSATEGDFDPTRNGRSGEYMQIGLMSGRTARIDLRFIEAKTGKRLVMPKYAISFFDLDCAKDFKSKESVTIGGDAHHKTSSRTEVEQTDIGGEIKFAASTVGRWDDGPKNPHLLTQQQKNRAVSLLFHDASELHFTLTAEDGQGARFFNMANRASVYCAVTVSEGAAPPLPDLPVHPPAEQPVRSKHGETFVEFVAEEGDAVKTGDPLFKVQDREGNMRTVNAPADGIVLAVQDKLKKGDSLDARTSNHVIAVVGRDNLAPLPVDRSAGDEPQVTNLPSGTKFKKYLKEQYDGVQEGDGIFVVESPSGKENVVKSTAKGIVKARQESLKKGDDLELVEDGNLMTIGKLAPLPIEDKESPMVVSDALPEGTKFVRYTVKNGDVIKTGTAVAVVKGPDGKERGLKSDRPGVVTATQDHLKPGMDLDEVMSSKTLVVLGQLPPLEVPDHAAGSMGPSEGEWQFDSWLAEVGDTVKDGDDICKLKGAGGFTEKIVTASKTGTVIERQDKLSKGDAISAMGDANFAVIGKIAGPDVGTFEKGVEAPEDAVFNKWLLNDGEGVRFLQPVAEVSIPTRRLVEADGTVRRLAAQTMQLPSPGSGSINYMAPLEPGKTIGSQTSGGPICKVYVGPPWYLFLLFCLMVLCCLLCCLFQVMKKPMPYTPMEPEPPAPEPEPVPEEKPDGLRLDFEENGTIHTVYAKYRPLGIKHGNLAPIIAHEFTVNSYAKMDLKVQKDWKLVKIDEEDVGDNTDFPHVEEKLNEHMKDFPLWPLHLQFKKHHEDPDSEEIELKFLHRPLGLEFTNNAPIEIKKVHDASPAHHAGVQVGWLLTGVGDWDVHAQTNFRDVMKYFKEGVKPLEEQHKHV